MTIYDDSIRKIVQELCNRHETTEPFQIDNKLWVVPERHAVVFCNWNEINTTAYNNWVYYTDSRIELLESTEISIDASNAINTAYFIGGKAPTISFQPSRKPSISFKSQPFGDDQMIFDRAKKSLVTNWMKLV
jgi:hypothetical protein